MKSQFNFILTILLLLFCSVANGQLLQTRSEIIQKNGYDYKTGVSNDGVKYIYYDKHETTSASGSYLYRKTMYFITLDDGKEICFLWKILEPSSETNSNVNHYKKKYVEIGNMRWEDYENKVIYDIDVKDGICITTATVRVDTEK